MLLQLTASAYFEFLQQFASLVRDPVGYGVGVPPGDGRPVLLIPGFTAGDWSLGTMARWLGRVGYRPYLSGIDLNVGCPQRTMEVVGWRVEKIARQSGQRVTIIGHSLGGVLGRAIAAANPANVREVVALGSPIRDGWTGVHDQVRPALQAIQSFWQTFSDEPESCGTAECSCAFVAAVLAPTPGRSRFSAISGRSLQKPQVRVPPLEHYPPAHSPGKPDADHRHEIVDGSENGNIAPLLMAARRGE